MSGARACLPLLAVLATAAACAAPADPPQVRSPVIEIEAIRATFLLPSGRDERRARGAVPPGLLDALRRFGGGGLEGLHLRLPAGQPSEFASALVRQGVNPRKISQDAPLGHLLATRYLAHPPSCAGGPVRDAASWGENAPDPQLGCALLVNLAATAVDPADLLHNAALAPVDPERAALPVARLRRLPGFEAPAQVPIQTQTQTQ